MDDGREPAFIFDIDGTLALKHPDRDIYEFDKVYMDLPHEDVVRMYHALRAAHPYFKFFIVTGRSEDCRYVTETWLKHHNIVYDKMFMRPSGDRREDTIIKQEALVYHIKPAYRIHGVFEDRLRVCRMWHAEGLTVFRIGDPDADY